MWHVLKKLKRDTDLPGVSTAVKLTTNAASPSTQRPVAQQRRAAVLSAATMAHPAGALV
jgi:hypothetical protein